MPAFEFELSEKELNKIRDKVMASIEKEIDVIARKSLMAVVGEEASANLLKQVTPKITEYTDKIKKITSDEGIIAMINKLGRRAISSAQQEFLSHEFEKEARTFVRKKVDEIYRSRILEDDIKKTMNDIFNLKFHNFQNEFNLLIKALEAKIEVIHKNQDFLANKIGII